MNWRGWLIARFWYNGGKLTLASLTVVLLAAILLVTQVCDNVTRVRTSATPIEVRAPFEVSTGSVEIGGRLTMLTDFCNHSDQAVEMTYQGRYIRIGDEGHPEEEAPGTVGTTEVPPGCHIDPFVVVLPDDLVPGFWYRESIRTYEFEGEVHTLTTRTEIFEVVE